ncbi:F-box/RNI-like superfamily protein [Klebsormidium nitens]|uniref:F-box/RNI-like superfamily protein n=1 Tax=Klebsormidium nitens TaxID=105231 RepID=A0A1Y1IKW6_KLENI|nr:F-box/RNI-like superfamily protein [Klebsormidium nitens]|eukprot:GAQ90069.1 F-box/RNI-like superfamily protein [Klebsormidium nitens]
MEFLRRCSRLTRFEEDLVAQGRRLVGEAFALGERIAFQVSRATGDAVVEGCESIFSPSPLSQSPLLATSQDVEVLASSALLQEQHTCEVTCDEGQGPEQTQDGSFDLVPDSSSSALPVLAGAPPSLPPLSSSQDLSAHSPQLADQQIPREDTADAQGPEQKKEAFDDMVPAALDYELVSSVLHASDVLSSLHERVLCGATEGALPVGGEENFEGKEGSGSGRTQEVLLSGAACHSEEVEGVEVDQRAGAVGALVSGSTILDLDIHCLTKILSHLRNSSIRACSLVCREWLDASNYARNTLVLQGQPRVASLPRILLRFADLRFVQLTDTGKGLELQGTVPACLSDASLALLAKSCPHLFRLTLVRCGVVSDEGLATVLRRCPELTTLRMDHCEGFSGAAFEGVQCPIEQLDVHYCSGLTDAGVGAVASACPKLRHFTVRREGQVTDLAAGFEKVALLCPSLEKLTAIACGITDTTLRRFAGNCPLLADIRIVSEPGITDGGVAILRCRLRRLDHLTLLDNSQLWQVPRSGRYLRLKELGVGRFDRATDQMLQQIAEEQSLENLRIVRCPALTDRTVRKILFGCHQLRSLLIANCELVTSEILKAYAESGTKARVEIRGCKGVQKEMLPAEVRLSGKVVIG